MKSTEENMMSFPLRALFSQHSQHSPQESLIVANIWLWTIGFWVARGMGVNYWNWQQWTKRRYNQVDDFGNNFHQRLFIPGPVSTTNQKTYFGGEWGHQWFSLTMDGYLNLFERILPSQRLQKIRSPKTPPKKVNSDETIKSSSSKDA